MTSSSKPSNAIAAHQSPPRRPDPLLPSQAPPRTAGTPTRVYLAPGDHSAELDSEDVTSSDHAFDDFPAEDLDPADLDAPPAPQPAPTTPPPWLTSAIEVCAAIVDGDSNRRILSINNDEPAAKLLHLINDILDHNEGFMREAIAALQSAIDGRSYRKVQTNGTHGDHLKALTGIQTALNCIQSRSQELHLAEATRTQELKRAEAARSQMASSVSETIQVVESLASAADNISQFSSVIGTIASQTKMLALNAKIEAFRVGDAGRGFAVVAEEVKQLSLKASQTTAQINQKISSIQDATLLVNSAVSSIRKTLDSKSSPPEQLAHS